MLNPVSAARLARNIESNNSLARELLAKHPELQWPAPLSVGVKIGELDNGKPGWWIKRPEHAKALAELLNLTTGDLGLHVYSGRRLYEFKDFPALPPIDLGRESPCEIGNFVQVATQRSSDLRLDDWMGRSGGVQRTPAPGITWLYFPEGTGRKLFWAGLEARTPYDHLQAASLSSIATRVRQPRPIAIHVERNEGLSDLDVLLGRHSDTAVLIVAPHLPETRVDAKAAESFYDWEFCSATDEERRRLKLTNPNEIFDRGIDRYEWRLTDGWMKKLAKWVEKRLDAAQADTLFSADGLNGWLANFQFPHSSIETPSDFMAICRIFHQTARKSLPDRSSHDAGQRLLRAIIPANTTIHGLLVQVIEDRWNAEDLIWGKPLTLAQWQTVGPKSRYAPTEAELLSIADGSNKETRREKAKTLAERCIGAAGLGALLEERLLVSNHSGQLEIAPSFLADLIARDLLIEQIKQGPIENWAKFYFDDRRRPVVNSALEAFSTDELVSVAANVLKLPADSVFNIAASEALFVAAARHIHDRESLPESFSRLLSLVLSRLDVENIMPQLWTETFGFIEKPERIAIFWKWSMAKKPSKLKLPKSWAWWFPGWFNDLPDFSITLIPPMPQKIVLETKGNAPLYYWDSLLDCTDKLVERQEKPIGDPPDFMKPYLLAAGVQGRWKIDSSWWNVVITSELAEYLLLKKIKPFGTNAARELWPALLDYMNGVMRKGGGGTELILLMHSNVWIWIFESISAKDAVNLPSDEQMLALYGFPQALPPDVRIELLHRLPGEYSGAAALVRNIVEMCDEADIYKMTSLLGTDYGWPVAKKLWDMAPSRTEGMMLNNESLRGTALQQLIDLCPIERLGAAITVLQTRRDMFDADYVRILVRDRLPNAGRFAGELWKLNMR